mgnify:CR=1 FL=1
MYIELLGYLSSLLVVFSMLMTSVVKLRIINMIGSTLFAIYALLIYSYPTAATNACLIVINLYNLYRLNKNARNYAIVKLPPTDSFVRFFLDSHERDMKQFFPVINKNILYDYTCLICHDTNPVGILLAKTEEDGVLNIHVDYTIPAYRNSSVEKYLLTWLAKEPITKLVTNNVSETHATYLKKIGFTEKDGRLVKNIEKV